MRRHLRKRSIWVLLCSISLSGPVRQTSSFGELCHRGWVILIFGITLLTVNPIVTCHDDKSVQLMRPEDEYEFQVPMQQVRLYRLSSSITPHALWHWLIPKHQSPLSTASSLYVCVWGGRVLNGDDHVCVATHPRCEAITASSLSIYLAPSPPLSNLS